MKTNTLVIMAAGFGSRYKGGIKQMDGVGPNGEWIMDYSIYDAYQAGIKKVVLIIREELKDLIASHFTNLPDDLDLELVYQSIADIPQQYSYEERTKPWGTGQAILCCKNVVHEPFIVINSDDYYGKSIFQSMNSFLNQNTNAFCMGGYLLKNTLSENGGVNRGICQIDSHLHLIDVNEIYKIEKINNEIIGKTLEDQNIVLDSNEYCSLNCFGFTPIIFEELETKFTQFLDTIKDVTKEEFLLPDVVKSMIQSGKVVMEVLPTQDEWFGMTYQEDKERVEKKIQYYIKAGNYPEKLWK